MSVWPALTAECKGVHSCTSPKQLDGFEQELAESAKYVATGPPHLLCSRLMLHPCQEETGTTQSCRQPQLRAKETCKKRCLVVGNACIDLDPLSIFHLPSSSLFDSSRCNSASGSALIASRSPCRHASAAFCICSWTDVRCFEACTAVSVSCGGMDWILAANTLLHLLQE